MNETTARKWVNVDAGPIQLKRVQKALSAVNWEGKTFTRLSGVVGEPEGRFDRTTMTEPFGTARPETAEVLADVGERFDYTITKKNVNEVIAALEGARVHLAANRPERDERITKEEKAERVARVDAMHVAQSAGAAIQEELRKQVIAAMPDGAKALIVAQCKEDDSDPMTDYFSNKTQRCVAIGWRFSAREDFKRLHAVAGTFVETEHLVSQEALTAWVADKNASGYGRYVAENAGEHRDNYSMGAGNYLSDHGWDGSGSGWVVKSYNLGGYRDGDRVDVTAAWWPSLTELHLPDKASADSTTTDAVTGETGVIVRPSSTGRAGFVELVFPSKPSEDVRQGLKSHGFRWARSNACWYGRDTAYANKVAGIADGAS